MTVSHITLFSLIQSKELIPTPVQNGLSSCTPETHRVFIGRLCMGAFEWWSGPEQLLRI